MPIIIPPWASKEIHDKIERGEELTREEKYQYLQTSRMSNSGISPEKILMAFVLVRLSKTDKGLEVIKVLGKEFIKGIFDTLHALGQASAANVVSAWANPYLVNNVLDRFGFVNSQASSEFKLGLSVISGAKVAEGFVDTIQGFFPFSSPEPSEYPASIVYSARKEGDKLTKEVHAEVSSIEEIRRLETLWGKKEP